MRPGFNNNAASHALIDYSGKLASREFDKGRFMMANTDMTAAPADTSDVPVATLPESTPRARAQDARESDAIDPVIETVLARLWDAANDPSGKIWSLAKLSKRTQLPQSTLRRYLTSLTEAGLVTVTLDDAGLGSSTLTEFGRSICTDLFDTGA